MLSSVRGPVGDDLLSDQINPNSPVQRWGHCVVGLTVFRWRHQGPDSLRPLKIPWHSSQRVGGFLLSWLNSQTASFNLPPISLFSVCTSIIYFRHHNIILCFGAHFQPFFSVLEIATAIYFSLQSSVKATRNIVHQRQCACNFSVVFFCLLGMVSLLYNDLELNIVQ